MLEVLIAIFGFINLFYENTNTSNTFACAFFNTTLNHCELPTLNVLKSRIGTIQAQFLDSVNACSCTCLYIKGDIY